MDLQQKRGRCRVVVEDIEHYQITDDGIILYFFGQTFKKYSPKAKKGNDLVILQGTNKINEDYRGIFQLKGYRFKGNFMLVFGKRR